MKQVAFELLFGSNGVIGTELTLGDMEVRRKLLDTLVQLGRESNHNGLGPNRLGLEVLAVAHQKKH